MYLLHIIGSMDPISGGPAQGIRNSNFEMQKLGVYREVVSLDDPKSDFIGSDDFIIHALGPAKGPWRYSPKLIPWLAANLGRFDVVIINGLWLFSSYAGWKTLHQLDKRPNTLKWFVMPHGMLDPYFQRAPQRKFKAIRNWIYWKFIEKRIVNESDGLLFTCETELELARQSFRPYHPKRELNIGYGIMPPPVFLPEMNKAFQEKCPELKESPYLLFFSRIHKKKGLDLLIRGYAAHLDRALKEGYSIPKLVIAGPGLQTTFGENIKKMVCKTPELQSSVYFSGMLSGNEKWGALYGCDAFILPSHQENFGIAVVEALSCGKPVLISNKVNIWKEIASAGAGIISNDTFDGVMEMLESWLNLSHEYRTSMGIKARETYKSNFDSIPISKKLFEALIS